jgi:hypothetical protein
MSDFERLKAGLKDKWLDYYEANQVWIDKFSCWIECIEGEDTRPNSQIILAAISLLEPRVVNYLIPLLEIDDEGEQVVKTLGLDFRPEKELEKRAEERSQQAVNQLESQFSDPELEKIRQELQTN